MSKIKFKRTCTAMGRNGTSHCVGVELFYSSRIDENNCSFNVVSISPINSQGTITNCWIEIPYDNLGQIIKDLQEHYDQPTKT